MIHKKAKGSRDLKKNPLKPEEELGQEVGKRFREMYPDADPVSYLEALNMLTDQGGEDKLAEPVDISDVPDKPSDLPLYTKFTDGKTLADLDMWQDRTNKMICGSCMNYLAKGQDVFGKDIGACKDNSPTMKGYPRVYEDEPGCGAHKMRVITL